MNHYLITSNNIFDHYKFIEDLDVYLNHEDNRQIKRLLDITIHNSKFIEIKTPKIFSVPLIYKFKEDFPGIKIVQKLQRHRSTKYITL